MTLRETIRSDAIYKAFFSNDIVIIKTIIGNIPSIPLYKNTINLVFSQMDICLYNRYVCFLESIKMIHLINIENLMNGAKRYIDIDRLINPSREYNIEIATIKTIIKSISEESIDYTKLQGLLKPAVRYKKSEIIKPVLEELLLPDLVGDIMRYY